MPGKQGVSGSSSSASSSASSPATSSVGKRTLVEAESAGGAALAGPVVQRQTAGAASPGPAAASPAEAAAGPAGAPVWVEFQRGEWDGKLVLANLQARTSVPGDLATAILAGALATAKYCVELRKRVDAAAAADPTRSAECERIHRALSTRIVEMVYGTAQSPLQYSQLGEVATWSAAYTAVAPTAGEPAAPAAGADPAAAAADRGEFADQYYRGGVLQAHRLDKTMTYDKFKEAQGPLKATSEMATDAQRKHSPLVQTLSRELTGDDLLFIYDRLRPPKDPGQLAALEDKNKKLKDQMPGINAAFRMMKLDTAGAQGHYLANAYMESSQLEFMTETQKAAGDKPFQDSGDARLDTGWLNDAKDGNANGLKVTGYEPGGSVNAAGTQTEDHWDKSFIGRGPIQVTHDWGYLQTLAVMENRLDELVALPEGAPERADIPLLAEAVRAIKADPRMAADRRYTFLFSAAAMKRRMPSATKPGAWTTSLDGQIASSSNPAITGMGDHSQVPESKAKKDAVFQRAVQRITENNKQAQPAP